VIIKSDIISLLNDALNQTAKLRKGGDQLTYHCPACKHHKRKLEVCLEEGNKFGIFNCWTCGTSGNLGKLLKIINAAHSYRDKLFQLTKDIRIIRKRSSKVSTSEVVLPDEFRSLTIPRKTPEYKNALVYLQRRGILREDILRYNIGYCEEGPYDQHIIIPSYDAKGIINFFIGRRYYNTEGIIPYKKPYEASMNIIGFECFINYNEPLNLCEGVFDGIAIRNNAVPLFGKCLSKKLQEAMLINKTPRVNMILDNDAMKESIRNCKMMMRLGINVHLVRLNGKDPSVLGFEKIHTLIRESKQFTDDDLLRYELGL
jgi:DNA primase